LPSKRKPVVPVSDRELLDAVMRDLRAIYSDVLKQPLPPALAAALVRLECRNAVADIGMPSGKTLARTGGLVPAYGGGTPDEVHAGIALA
jgi:hypothetical protein